MLRLSNDPEVYKIGGAIIAFIGVSLSDLEALVRIGVGVATFCYIGSKAYRIWFPKPQQKDEDV